MRKITPKQQRFAEEYLVDLNATQAAIRAGYSPSNADKIGGQLLGKRGVEEAVAALVAKRSKDTGVTAAAVLSRWWLIATADANELIEYRRTCCRHCWGDGFGHQRTPGEMASDRAAHAAERRKAAAQRKPAPPRFDEAGGDGFDHTRPPNPRCPECCGDGVGVAHAKDTRNLSPAARALYAGVKVTKDGLEVKLHDQLAAMANVARHLGMFEDLHKHEHSGPGGKAIQHDHHTDELRGLSDADLAARLAAAQERVRAAAALGGGGGPAGGGGAGGGAEPAAGGEGPAPAE
ncbi:MAG TPA: terminase small subunit [Urbifossiella sp.]|nr:terminase small subunit [Urbifossiella sp.]